MMDKHVKTQRHQIPRARKTQQIATLTLSDATDLRGCKNVNTFSVCRRGSQWGVPMQVIQPRIAVVSLLSLLSVSLCRAIANVRFARKRVVLQLGSSPGIFGLEHFNHFRAKVSTCVHRP